MSNHTSDSPSVKSFHPNIRRYIAAAVMSDGDVLGVYADGRNLTLSWVNDFDDSTPITIFPEDLPLIAKLISDAQDALERLQSGGV